ncbi:MAG: hypothetical protein KDC87_13795 [Planctomycetes bacterium]|nr:hypothetical protein [Planctomycetota bacterium]MCB9889662.1 hypothetical protein [Planctomycetota bacterium]
MNNLFSVAPIVLCLGGALAAQIPVGEVAPAFEFKESIGTKIGDFKSLRGKVLMLDFFATW